MTHLFPQMIYKIILTTRKIDLPNGFLKSIKVHTIFTLNHDDLGRCTHVRGHKQRLPG